MNNTTLPPAHILDKGAWESFTENGMHTGYTYDVLTDENRARYAAVGDVLVDQWSVYRYGNIVFTVNTDGSLRSMSRVTPSL